MKKLSEEQHNMLQGLAFVAVYPEGLSDEALREAADKVASLTAQELLQYGQYVLGFIGSKVKTMLP